MNKEQLKETEATLSCKITGLTKQLDKITWTKSDGTLITSGQDGITIDDGILDDNSSQTTTLTVSGDENGQDTTFTCVITSLEHDVVERSTTVNLEVFCKYIIICFMNYYYFVLFLKFVRLALW